MSASVASFHASAGQDVAELREKFRAAEESWRKFGSELFAVLAAGTAGDEALLEIAASAKPGQPVDLLLLCAAHFLAMDEPDSEMAAYFPLLADQPRPPQTAFPVFRQFCLARRDRLIRILASRQLQMTFPGRAAFLIPAFARVAAETGEPFSLVEIGCSAGVNLLFDRYSYDIGGTRLGDPAAPVQLRCEMRGRPAPLPDHLPRIATRIGIDLDPIDVGDPAERRWADALLFPEWIERRQTLRAALDLRAGYPLEVIKGDALSVLPDLLARLSGPLCVLDSHCMYQWPMEARDALDRLLCEASLTRTIHFVAQEQVGNLPRGFVQREWDLSQAKRTDLFHTVYAEGRGTTTILGQNDGFGAWMEWEA
jgi:hypothetical protein